MSNDLEDPFRDHVVPAFIEQVIPVALQAMRIGPKSQALAVKYLDKALSDMETAFNSAVMDGYTVSAMAMAVNAGFTADTNILEDLSLLARDGSDPVCSCPCAHH